MKVFDTIQVVWRKGSGARHKIGVLKKTADGKHIFKYVPNAIHLKTKEGQIMHACPAGWLPHFRQLYISFSFLKTFKCFPLEITHSTNKKSSPFKC